MKHVLKVAFFAAAMFACVQSQAQTHKDPTLGHQIDHTAKKVGHATAHTAASGAAAVTDKRYEGKCGPQGQTIYINKHSHYFYISKRGHRIYLKKSELMDKPMK